MVMRGRYLIRPGNRLEFVVLEPREAAGCEQNAYHTDLVLVGVHISTCHDITYHMYYV
jgi:hypothetical protein